MQVLHGPRDMILYRLYGDAQPVRDLLLFQPFETTQLEYLPALIGQFIDSLVKFEL